MTGTSLITEEQLTFDQMARMTGQNNYDGDTRSSMPWVTVNKDGEDDDGRTIPVGTLTVEVPGSPRIYAKTMVFRPFMRGFQYRKYDQEKQKTTSKTKIIFAWKEEPYDTTGTIRCGKIKVKKGEPITPDQEAINKQVRCYMMLFGVGTMTGVDTSGQEHTHTNVPMAFRIRGTSYMEVDIIIQQLNNKKRQMFNTELDLSLRKGKAGSNVYYTIVPKVDYTKPLVAVTQEDMATFKNFGEYVTAANTAIREDYLKAIGGGNARPTDVIDAEVVEVVKSKSNGRTQALADDFHDDDISDIGGNKMSNLDAG